MQNDMYSSVVVEAKYMFGLHKKKTKRRQKCRLQNNTCSEAKISTDIILFIRKYYYVSKLSYVHEDEALNAQAHNYTYIYPSQK